MPPSHDFPTAALQKHTYITEPALTVSSGRFRSPCRLLVGTQRSRSLCLSTQRSVALDIPKKAQHGRYDMPIDAPSALVPTRGSLVHDPLLPCMQDDRISPGNLQHVRSGGGSPRCAMLMAGALSHRQER